MGISGIGPGSLLLILLIVVLLFGTKRIKSIGSDLGGAVKGFRNSMREAEEPETAAVEKKDQGGEPQVIEGEPPNKEQTKS